MNLNEEIVVIIGSGRSGTSLLVQLLTEMGMYNYNNFSQPKEGDPLGLFEDAEIVSIHKEMLETLNVHPMLPFVNTEFTEIEKREFKYKLKSILRDRLDRAEGQLWGFKDPRTTSFLPIWNEIFKEENLTPRYILALRNPSSVVASMIKQNENGQLFAELAWLWRNCEAISQTKGEMFVVNYEHWFEVKGSELASSLANFLNLPQNNAKALLENIVKSNLNRSTSKPAKIKNSNVEKLYHVIKQCNGLPLDTNALTEVAEKYLRKLEDYFGWAEFANQNFTNFRAVQALSSVKSENGKLIKNQKILKRKLKTLTTVEQDNINLARKTRNFKQKIQILSTIKQDNHNLLRKTRNLKQKIQILSTIKQDNLNLLRKTRNLKQKIQTLSAIKQKAKLLHEENAILISSTAYKLGSVLLSALKRPGKKTILLPYNLYKIARSSHKQ